jgi:hypothetical protein
MLPATLCGARSGGGGSRRSRAEGSSTKDVLNYSNPPGMMNCVWSGSWSAGLGTRLGTGHDGDDGRRFSLFAAELAACRRRMAHGMASPQTTGGQLRGAASGCLQIRRKMDQCGIGIALRFAGGL